ncbi:MAG: hypothetical protein HYV04_21145 [Deltaproteobacteria bacterium]|nr:hypothetical protein [Deltaproteobacteria bacterium]
MDWLTFIAELFKALTWPVVVVAVVLLLRREIRNLLPFLKRLKAGPVEAEFDREVQEIKSGVETQLPSIPPSVTTSPEQQKLLQLAEVNPRSAIIEAWRGLEFAARKLLESQDPSLTLPEFQPPIALRRALNRLEVLTRDEMGLFNDLRSLRNQAVHQDNFAPSYESVLNYIDLAVRLRSAIDSRLRGGTVG